MVQGRSRASSSWKPRALADRRGGARGVEEPVSFASAFKGGFLLATLVLMPVVMTLVYLSPLAKTLEQPKGFGLMAGVGIALLLAALAGAAFAARVVRLQTDETEASGG